MVLNGPGRKTVAAASPVVSHRNPGTTPFAKAAKNIGSKSGILKQSSSGGKTDRRTFLSSKMALVGVLAALALTTVALFYLAVDANPAPPIHTNPAAKAGVVASGLVEADGGLLKLSFEVPGTLRHVYVREGQSVNAGDVIAQLDDADCVSRVEAAKADGRLATAQLQTLRADLESEALQASCEVERCKAELAILKAGARSENVAQARAEVDAVEAEARRAAGEYNKYENACRVDAGAVSVQQRDNARQAAESSAARLKAAKESLALLIDGARKEELQRAEALLSLAVAKANHVTQSRDSRLEAASARTASAAAQVLLAETELQKRVMRAPTAGVIAWQYKHAGESVGALTAEPIVALVDMSKLQVRADVDESDFSRICMGQRAYVTADAWPGRKFWGRVISIGAAVGQKRFTTGDLRERMDVKIVEVVIQMEEASLPALKPGLRVTAWFVPQKG